MKNILASFDAVIFDMDGVLVDSEPFYTEAEQVIFRKVGLDISEAEHQTYQGTASVLMWELIREKHGTPHSVEELEEIYVNQVTPYFDSLETIDPMPGVEALIKRLKQRNTPIALASSSYIDVIEIILRLTGLNKYLVVCVDSRRAQSSKPAPDIFLLAAEELGVAPQKCAVIEDSTNGIRAAKAAGMYCIAFAGADIGLQDHSEADLVISDFNSLS